MNMVADKAPAEERQRFVRARRHSALYKAASLLWARGVPMAEAIKIVESAMIDAGELQ